jgi:hypothetical protein
MSMICNLRLLRREELAALHAEPESIEALIAAEGSDDHAELCIDKAWHGIHFLLTSAESAGGRVLDFLVGGGRPVGDVDVGYGPGRTFSTLELEAIGAALESLTPELLDRRFEARRMLQLEIYPQIWGEPEGREGPRSYLLERFVLLKRFIEQGRREGKALLVYLS